MVPHLAIVHANDRTDSQLYIRKKIAALTRLGFQHSHHQLGCNVDDIRACILRLNADRRVHGIIIQSPLYREIEHHFGQLADLIAPDKDVDGLGRHTRFVPCTALAVHEILCTYNVEARGKHALIIGRSRIVGEPIARLLSAQHATVSIAHSETPSRLLRDLIRVADIVVSAAGVPGLVDARLLKPDSVVVDVGISYNKESVLCGDVLHDSDQNGDQNGDRNGDLNGDLNGDQNGSLNGDHDNHDNQNQNNNHNNNHHNHYYYTPVPGGVGPVTVAKLADNLLLAYRSLLQ